MTQIKTAIARAATSLRKGISQDLSREAISIRRARLQLLQGVLKEAITNHENAIADHQRTCSEFAIALDALLKALAKMGEAARRLNALGDPLGIRPAIGQHHQRVLTRIWQCLNDFKHDSVYCAIASNTKKEDIAHARCTDATDQTTDPSGDRPDV